MTVDLPARTTICAGPLLTAFNAAAVVSSADVHVARRLGRLCGEDDERVLLAVALAVRAVRSGSVCVRLDDLDGLTVPEAEDTAPVEGLPWPEQQAWHEAVRSSPLVAQGTDDGGLVRPVRWVGGRLYLDRYWRDEQAVRRHVDDRLAASPTSVDLARLAATCRRQLPEARDDRQRLAAALAAISRLTVLTGGPGTGKTTTVARVLAVLHEVAGPGLRVALAAPTGKAAARLQEAVRDVVATMEPADQRRVGEPEATTIHRLLGWVPGTSTRFRHGPGRHLPHDVVVVDETSMVSLPLMARLLEALRPDTRLLLVGDPDQLASVEAGAVLGDLVARGVAGVAQGSGARAASGTRLVEALVTALPADVPAEPAARAPLARAVVRLEVVHRHGDVITALAAAVRAGRTDDVLSALRSGAPAVSFVETSGDAPSDTELADVRARAEAAGVALVQAARAADAAAALRALESHRVLVAHRRGPAGVRHWASLVEQWVQQAWGRTTHLGATAGGGGDDPALAAAGQWYAGRPLLVTRNDRDTGLFNGDTGVVVATADGGVAAAFGDPSRPLLVRPHRLPTVETVHAMTVHRSQGSQFGAVSLVLPPASSPLLTRELLYTALTRATREVHVIGSEAAVRAAVERPVRRASGLREP